MNKAHELVGDEASEENQHLSLLDTLPNTWQKKKKRGGWKATSIFFFPLRQNVTKISKDQESNFFISQQTYFCHTRKFVSQIS